MDGLILLEGDSAMCLDVVYRGKQKREALAKLPDEFVVWKVVRQYADGNRKPLCFGQDCSLEAGEMAAPYRGGTGEGYRAGWHANLSREGVVAFVLRTGWSRVSFPYEEDGAIGIPIIKCKAKKKHIVAIGEQCDRKVVVLSHITFPKKCGVRKT